jgi:DNA-binding NarL/FixJ family response regulator
MHDPIYALCSSEQLRAIAQTLEALARSYRARADALDDMERTSARASRAVQVAQRTPEIVARYISDGLALPCAQAQTAIDTGLPIDTIAWHWKKHLRDRNATATKHRNALIMSLASRGLTNHDIAAKTGLHPGSVSRIIGKTLRSTATR